MSLFMQNISYKLIDFIKFKYDKINTSEPTEDDYENLNRRKTRFELVLISLVVFGIEICYAAETAFVSPIIQKIGVPVWAFSMVWALSPMIGFFTCPILGSLSDGCTSRMGRRRPFIIIYSFGIIIGLILTGYSHIFGEIIWESHGGINPFVIILTIIGVVLLDFDCDACQAPARAYLIDVSNNQQDHPVGLATFTIMAGAGGALGYFLGGIPWTEFGSDDNYRISDNQKSLIKSNTTNGTIYIKSGLAYDHKQLLFTFVAVIYVICALVCITSFKEIPLGNTNAKSKSKDTSKNIQYEKMEESSDDESQRLKNENNVGYIAAENNKLPLKEASESVSKIQAETLGYYVMSIIKMPPSLKWLCLTHCLCWMSLLCYSLYFTDFVGEEIYGGLPIDNKNLDQVLHKLYDRGVRAGSFFMSIYSISCSFYSFFLQVLINRFSTKHIYMFSQLIYSLGMILLALTKSKLTAVFTSLTAGVMYSCLFTIPFILVASYHSNESFEHLEPNMQILNNHQDEQNKKKKRGLGTDLSVVSSMVFIAQFILSLFVGTLIKLIGTKSVVIYLSSVLSLGAALSSTKLLYLD